jgi:hypothetical protein
LSSGSSNAYVQPPQAASYPSQQSVPTYTAPSNTGYIQPPSPPPLQSPNYPLSNMLTALSLLTYPQPSPPAITSPTGFAPPASVPLNGAGGRTCTFGEHTHII